MEFHETPKKSRRDRIYSEDATTTFEQPHSFFQRNNNLQPGLVTDVEDAITDKNPSS